MRVLFPAARPTCGAAPGPVRPVGTTPRPACEHYWWVSSSQGGGQMRSDLTEGRLGDRCPSGRRCGRNASNPQGLSPCESEPAKANSGNSIRSQLHYSRDAIVPELGISFSEAEYAEGYRLDKPCLVYMRDDDVPVLPKHIERDPDKIRLLERWKQTLLNRHTVAIFASGQALAVQVAADLSRTIQTLSAVEIAKSQTPAYAEQNVTQQVSSIVEGALADGVTESDVVSAIRSTISALLAEQGKRTPSVFLSYSKEDKEIVRRVAEGLAGVY